jgi:hypothetical protein
MRLTARAPPAPACPACRHGALTSSEIPKSTAGEKSVRGKQTHKSEKPADVTSMVFSGAL